ncbi:MAG TPA: DUF5675 family protein [Thermoanaerobaculia bacterium]|jgi:hypothetical protein|nr:DUF5675 family protein [Thermoanaerobaculia bacterium]
MDMQVTRQTFTDESTIGELTIDGVHQCFTLEDKVREQKVFGETAIPAGRYEVVVNFSNHFQKMLPELVAVPNFEGVRIHSGNTAKDTEGCILVGVTKGTNVVSNSKDAFNVLFAKIQAAAAQEKVFIEIK